jgi:hypothetical protein
MRQLQIIVRGTDRVGQAIVIGRGPPSPISNRAPAKAQSRRQSERLDQQVEPPSVTPRSNLDRAQSWHAVGEKFVCEQFDPRRRVAAK